MQDVLKEFFVKLTYQIDSASHAKFEKGLKGATDAAIGLGKAVAVAAAAVSLAVAKIGKDLDDLYYQAQRNQAAASSIRAMGYAVSQLGGSYQSAIGTIEAFGAKMRQNPGYESMAKQLGVMTRQNGKLRDTVDIIRDIGSALKDKPYAVQFAYAQAFGIDEATWRAIQSGEMTKRMDEYRAKARDLGVDTELAAKRGNEFWTAMRSLNAVLGLIGEKMALELLPSLTEFVKRVEAFLTSNADSIVAFFKEMGILAGKLGDMLRELLKIMHPLWEMFDKWAQSLTGHSGLAVALTAIIAIKMAAWLMGIASAILAVGAASNAALLSGSLGRFLGMLGIRAVGAGALAAPLLGGLETPESYEARRQADPEFKRKTDEVNAGNGGVIGTIKRWWKGDSGGGNKSASTDQPAVSNRSIIPFRGRLSKAQAAEMVAGIEKTAKDLGINPNDVAAAISYETGGTFDPWKKGPTTKWGQHRGLIQWGEPQRKKYGVTENSTISEQMSAVTKYLRDAGVKPGHGLLDVYSAINAGSVGRYNASDAHAGGAPGSVADKVRTMGAHRLALSRLRLAGAGSLALPSLPAVPDVQKSILDSLAAGGGVAPTAGAPLAPAGAGDNNVNMNQKTEITVIGSSDPAGTAGAIADQQKSVNSGLQRNVQRAVQ